METQAGIHLDMMRGMIRLVAMMRDMIRLLHAGRANREGVLHAKETTLAQATSANVARRVGRAMPGCRLRVGRVMLMARAQAGGWADQMAARIGPARVLAPIGSRGCAPGVHRARQQERPDGEKTAQRPGSIGSIGMARCWE